MAPQASQLYSKNIVSFITTLLKDGKLNVDVNDELTRGPMVVHEGKVVNEQVRAALGGAPAE
jgi:NAD/NADP transhydrogenase alpha subunit